MSQDKFKQYFKTKDFASACLVLRNLSVEEQQQCLAELYQQAMNQTSPAVVSVLYRKLKPGKTFADFRAAHLPPSKFCKPEQIGEYQCQNFFPVPTRVMNAVDQQDASMVLSVGLTWSRDASESQRIMNFISEIKANGVNDIRTQQIDAVAEKIDAAIYELKSDDQFGSPF